jgi:hypothetical protein
VNLRLVFFSLAHFSQEELSLGGRLRSKRDAHVHQVIVYFPSDLLRGEGAEERGSGAPEDDPAEPQPLDGQ